MRFKFSSLSALLFASLTLAFSQICFASNDIGVGVSVSDDNGAHWTNYTTAQGLASNRVNAVFAQGPSIYAATWGGLSVSNDNGAHWTNYTTAQGLANNFVAAVYAQGPSIYAATFRGLSVSNDNGAHWTTYTTAQGLGGNDVRAVYARGRSIYVGTFSSSVPYVQGTGLSVSNDNGATWTTYTTAKGLADDCVKGIYAQGRNIYAATDKGLSVSNDDGAHWITAQGLVSDYGINAVFAQGRSIYAATNGGLAVSDDNGTNWNHYTFKDHDQTFGTYAQGSVIYATAADRDTTKFDRKSSLWISRDNGAHWVSYTISDKVGDIKGGYAQQNSIYLAVDGCDSSH